MTVATSSTFSTTNQDIPQGSLGGTAFNKIKSFDLKARASSFSGGLRALNIKDTRKYLGRLIPLGILLIIIVALFGWVKDIMLSVSQAKTNQAVVAAPIATQTLNKKNSFPLKDSKGTQISSIGYAIDSAELRSEIIVSGQKATAVQGKIFLILQLRVTNEYNLAIDINTRDYIRLTVNGKNTEFLAPDIHNDPVNVQAVSTKYSRLGFAINESDKNLVLYIGEINGKKESLPLSLKK